MIKARALASFELYKSEIISINPLDIKESYLTVNIGDEVEIDSEIPTSYALFGEIYDVAKDEAYGKISIELIEIIK